VALCKVKPQKIETCKAKHRRSYYRVHPAKLQTQTFIATYLINSLILSERR